MSMRARRRACCGTPLPAALAVVHANGGDGICQLKDGLGHNHEWLRQPTLVRHNMRKQPERADPTESLAA